MSGLLTTLLIGGLIIGGAVVLINPDNRCNFLGLCGQTAGGETPVEGDTLGVDESSTNLNEQGNWDRNNAGNKGCCVCQMQGDRVKCQRHGGAWFNPAAGPGGSNDQSLELSLEECNKGCGSSASFNESEKEKFKQKTVKCPSGYYSADSKCYKRGTGPAANSGLPGTGKATGGSVTTKPAPKPAPKKNPVTSWAQNSQARLDAHCKGKPKTGMCANARYTNAYFTSGHYYSYQAEAEEVEEIETYDNRFQYTPNTLPIIRGNRLYY